MTKKIAAADLGQSLPKPSKADTDYETEDHMRTLDRAADIMSDPAKLKKVHKLAGRKHKALMGMVEPAIKKPKIRSLDDLKKRAAQPAQEEADEDME